MKVRHFSLSTFLFLFASLYGTARADGLSLQAITPQPSSLSPVRGTLPPIPGGRATVIGGEIRNVDSVRDQFSLRIFGGKTMKILYDERTQFYRDQTRITVLDLHANDHASVETTLDGIKVFALRIHIFSELPEGEVQGQVSSYDAQTGQLAVVGAVAKESVTLHVPSGLKAALVGQQGAPVQTDGSVNLQRGSLIDVKFKAQGSGQGEVTHIDILAVPGSAFTFNGSLSSLDVQAGRLVIVDPKDGQSHLVSYDPEQFPVSRKLQVGSFVRVTTSYDGSQYRASEIILE